MAWEEWEELKAQAVARGSTPMRVNQLAPLDGAAGAAGARPDIAIRTPPVHTAAGDMDDLFRQAMRRLEHSLDTSDEVYSYHLGNGWESPAHLKVCAQKWEGHLVSLAKEMGDLSAKLKDSANGYDSADAEAEARLRAAARDLGKA
ncbi:MAG: hypothetical protein QOC85_2941 [Streptomyces sp.]|nr:hypothetical protein [Streptomyces sp.]